MRRSRTQQPSNISRTRCDSRRQVPTATPTMRATCSRTRAPRRHAGSCTVRWSLARRISPRANFWRKPNVRQQSIGATNGGVLLALSLQRYGEERYPEAIAACRTALELGRITLKHGITSVLPTKTRPLRASHGGSRAGVTLQTRPEVSAEQSGYARNRRTPRSMAIPHPPP